MEGWKKRFQSFQRCVAGFFRDRIEPSSCRARSSSSCVCKNPSNRFSLRSRGSAHRICQVSRTLIRALLSLPRFLSLFLVVIPQGLLIRKHPLNRNPPISLIASRSFENLFRSLFFSFSIIFVSIRKVFASCVARGSSLRFRFGAKCMEGIVESCLFKSFASFNEAFQTEGM